MNKLYRSTAARITAALLFAVLLTATVGGVVGIVFMTQEGFYSHTASSFTESQSCENITQRNISTVYYNYLYLYAASKSGNLYASQQRMLKQYETRFSPENTNFRFTVKDDLGRVFLSNWQPADNGAELIWSNSYNGWVDRIRGRLYREDELVDSYVGEIKAKDEYYFPYVVFTTLSSYKYAIIIITAISAIAAILLFIFLMRCAGRRKDTGEITHSFIDNIPFDLLAAVVLLVWYIIANAALGGLNDLNIAVNVLSFCVGGILASLAGIVLCVSFAARVKTGKWWRNTLIYRLLILLKRFAKRLGKWLNEIVSNLPLLWKAILTFVAYLFINGIFVIILCSGGAAVIILGFIFNAAALFGICRLMLNLNRLKLGAERIASGELSAKIDTTGLIWDLKTHADALNNISFGMSRAVEERLKSERLKTELITNVSHDIKTPLTSIINYVDLLKKEKLENETALSYIEILDRQSSRLKKLTEDLVEASKAATGNITLNLERLDIAEFLNQSLGEYSERFAAGSLETVIRTPSGSAFITADGRLLWRVFDNLLNNIIKYTLPGTRVYADVDKIDRKVFISLKNISRYPLNISSDELLERFVRGDKSRATEGSGLGLAIAKSLTELQGGSFDLSIDGDLFKATIRFDAADQE